METSNKSRAINNRKKKQQLKKVKDVLSTHGSINARTNKPKANSSINSGENLEKPISQSKQSEKKRYGKFIEPQPQCSWAELNINDTKEMNYEVKDFEALIKVPLSEGSHFFFKAEQEWIDNEELSEFFSLDIKKLSDTIECIPFYELHDIEKNYFTKDQITYMQNKAAKAKEIYEIGKASNTFPPETSIEEIKTLSIEKGSCINEKEDDTNLEDDLDFLLSLKEPIERNKPSLSAFHFEPRSSLDAKVQPKDSSKTKSIDLEDWLDSVLDA